MTLTPPLVIQLADVESERVRANHEQRIREITELPLARAKVIPGIVLADSVETPVLHGLGRRPLYVRESCVRGAVSTGRVEEVRSFGSTHDPAQRLILKATGWGATVTVDVLVF